MKEWLAEKLICPSCPEGEPLTLSIQKVLKNDVLEGDFTCPSCGASYPIREGIAVLLPEKTRGVLSGEGGYNSSGMLAAYLWSHYGDVFRDPDATDAYGVWAANLSSSDGPCLDVGCAVGRLTFELGKAHHAVGIDTSLSFIRKAREILQKKRLDVDLIVEGRVTRPAGCDLQGAWNFETVEFILADALALPFRKNTFATAAAVNILEKVPDPLKHLRELNRVLLPRARFLFSDPFSWDEAFSSPDAWLGGNPQGPYPPRGIDTIRRLFTGEWKVFDPPFVLIAQGETAWKIRKTAHLWEHITSQYLVGYRG